MTHIHAHRCDGCGTLDQTHPDDGPPTGWYLLALMSQPGCWDRDWHFCDLACLDYWLSQPR